jgi:glyoxylase-like metal-dependent hydrolase (beta-lactamase superfamily II)
VRAIADWWHHRGVKIGDIEILPVLDGSARLRPTAAYAGTTEADWAPHGGLLDPDGRLEMAFGGFLVRAGDRVVLIDAGVGPDSPSPFMSGGQLLDNLARQQVSPGEITDVIFTHLHFDHVGWASRAGEAVFPNATYRCDGRDWEYFVEPPPELHQRAEADNPTAALTAPGSCRTVLEPIASHLEPWHESTTLMPGVDVRLAAGHTPGSGVIVISSGTARAVLLGDVAHCPIELLDDEWATLGDVDPAMATRTRVALMREFERQDVPITASHFPGLRFGRVVQAQGKRQWVI